MSSRHIKIELVYATAERQALIELSIEEGSSVEDAISESAIYGMFPDHGLEQASVGVWGRPVDRRHTLRAGDRIEIYRPLQMDPRESRRLLAEQGRTMSQGLDD